MQEVLRGATFSTQDDPLECLRVCVCFHVECTMPAGVHSKQAEMKAKQCVREG